MVDLDAPAVPDGPIDPGATAEIDAVGSILGSQHSGPVDVSASEPLSSSPQAVATLQPVAAPPAEPALAPRPRDPAVAPPRPAADPARRRATSTEIKGRRPGNPRSSRGGYQARLRPHERSGFKPDRVALWAVLLGLALLLGAVTSSHAAVLDSSLLHHLAHHASGFTHHLGGSPLRRP